MNERTWTAAALLLSAYAAISCSSDPTNPGGSGGSGGTDTNCEGRGETFFAGMKKSTADGQMIAEIVSADPAPPANADNNTWRVKLTTNTGDAVTGAEIVGAPFMIDHRHGAPSGLSSDLGGGSYSLGPLALRMAGLWSVTLKITRGGGDDEKQIVFSFCIPND